MTCQKNNLKLAYTPYKISLDIVDSRAKVGEHFHEFHYRVVEGTWKGMYLRCGGHVDQICALICHSFRVQHISGSENILQGGVQTTWSSEKHSQ
jgi:hypothetical protein